MASDVSNTVMSHLTMSSKNRPMAEFKRQKYLLNKMMRNEVYKRTVSKCWSIPFSETYQQNAIFVNEAKRTSLINETLGVLVY